MPRKNDETMKNLHALRDDIVSLLRESILVQSTLTVMVVGVWLYMVARGQTTPELLDLAVTTLLGFFFGSKLALRKATLTEDPRRRDDPDDDDHRAQRRGH